MTDHELKRTPLYAAHLALKGKMVNFGGWELPVQYRGIIEEHHNVRTKAGLFDVSHMGEIEIKGPDALLMVNKLLRMMPASWQSTRCCTHPCVYLAVGLEMIYWFTGWPRITFCWW